MFGDRRAGGRREAAAHALTREQVKGFWAVYAGWVLDGVDSVIYALVLIPALTELLPASGIAATPANLGMYGSILFALFLIGWGCRSSACSPTASAACARSPRAS